MTPDLRPAEPKAITMRKLPRWVSLALKGCGALHVTRPRQAHNIRVYKKDQKPYNCIKIARNYTTRGARQ